MKWNIDSWLATEYNYQENRDFVVGEHFRTMKELFSDTKYYSSNQ